MLKNCQIMNRMNAIDEAYAEALLLLDFPVMEAEEQENKASTAARKGHELQSTVGAPIHLLESNTSTTTYNFAKKIKTHHEHAHSQYQPSLSTLKAEKQQEQKEIFIAASLLSNSFSSEPLNSSSSSAKTDLSAKEPVVSGSEVISVTVKSPANDEEKESKEDMNDEAKATLLHPASTLVASDALVGAPPKAKKLYHGRTCNYCFATVTPMWRHGPAGYEDLCNKVFQEQ